MYAWSIRWWNEYPANCSESGLDSESIRASGYSASDAGEINSRMPIGHGYRDEARHAIEYWRSAVGSGTELGISVAVDKCVWWRRGGEVRNGTDLLVVSG